jgi:hypothetical protein
VLANINIIEKITVAILDASKKVGLEVNAEETKYGICPCIVTTLQDKITL